jgi:exonuclease III
MVWNVRGLNNPSRRSVVRATVAEAAPSIVCASETKLESVSPYVVAESFGARYDQFIYLPAVGTTGGIVLAWCSLDICILATRVDAFSVSVQIEMEGGVAWWLTTVYGPTVEALKPAFLDELRSLRLALVGPWSVAGDFNMIADARDKNNANLNHRAMSRFRAVINELELKEACLIGRRYTWSNEREHPTLVRLDRWFCSVEWADLYPDATLAALSSSLSDHCPIQMSMSVQIHTKRRFRFEKFWLKLEGFADVVVGSWGSAGAPADPLQLLDFKLRKLSRDLQRWSSKRVGNIRDQILIANEIIFHLEAAQDHRSLSGAETGLRRSLKLRLLGLASLERTIARQRARVAALRNGDASTQFFRICASTRQRRNQILRLSDGDATAEDQGDKEELATQFFARLLGHAMPREHDLSLGAMGLSSLDLRGLDATFFEDEVWAAVRAMPSSKSPGPDGFTWEFFRFCWDIVKGDALAAVQAVFCGCDQQFGRLNGAFITLVPKKEGVVDLKEFRPISLVHSFAKLVAKLLAIHLSPRMSELVSGNQSAFIHGRCIHDNFVLVRQSAVSMHCLKVPALLLKLDIARAFDGVSWPFLLSVL